jgi:peptide-methionine (S)-S-oxide reductase
MHFTQSLTLCTVGLSLAAMTGCHDHSSASEKRAATTTQSTRLGKDKPVSTQKATFAAGCFWGVELEFAQVPGVIKTTVGYTGGATTKPTYQEVCTDRTGHAEAVLVEFDPAKVTYDKLVDLFFELHDPTQVNRQGPDSGTQYRTAIFYHSPEQKTASEAAIKRLTDAKRFSRPIATQVVPAVEFYAAEDYHQQYFAKKGITKSCHRPG